MADLGQWILLTFPYIFNKMKPNKKKETKMQKFLLWLILLFLCWPLALLALIIYPFVWLLTLPFRLVGITVTALFDLLKSIITLPARLVKRV